MSIFDMHGFEKLLKNAERAQHIVAPYEELLHEAEDIISHMVEEEDSSGEIAGWRRRYRELCLKDPQNAS